MRPSRLGRSFLFALPVYFCLSAIALRTKLLLTPPWFDGTLARNHRLLLEFSYTNNEQSRLLQYYLPEMIHRLLSVSVPDAYLIQRWVFVFLTLACFHLFLREWMPDLGCMLAVSFFVAIAPLTYMPDLQESSSLLLLTFLLGLWCIRDRYTKRLAVVGFIGALNNETMLALILVYLFYNYGEATVRGLATLLGKTFLVSLPMTLPVLAIRSLTRDRPHLGPVFQLPNNVSGLLEDLRKNPLELYQASYLFPLLLFGVFWLYMLLAFRRKPLFLRRASLMIPFFIAGHLVTGIISESRQMLPLAFIVIPMALLYLFPELPALTRPPGEVENRSCDDETWYAPQFVRSGQSRRTGGRSRMKLHTLITIGLAVVVVALWLQNCSRPQTSASQPSASKPQPAVSVTDVRLAEPQNEGESYRVEATINHTGPGGPVDLTFQLRDKRSGEIVGGPVLGRAQLQPGAVLVAVAEIQAPRGDYEPEVAVQYPQR